MTSNSEIRIAKGISKMAKEISFILKVGLLCLVLSLATYGVLYFVFKPPINPPGTEFQYLCKYDEGISYSDHIEGRINEHRQFRFKTDINKKTTYTFFSLLILIISVRYIRISYNWVKKTSQLESKDDE